MITIFSDNCNVTFLSCSILSLFICLITLFSWLWSVQTFISFCYPIMICPGKHSAILGRDEWSGQIWCPFAQDGHPAWAKLSSTGLQMMVWGHFNALPPTFHDLWGSPPSCTTSWSKMAALVELLSEWCQVNALQVKEPPLTKQLPGIFQKNSGIFLFSFLLNFSQVKMAVRNLTSLFLYMRKNRFNIQQIHYPMEHKSVSLWNQGILMRRADKIFFLILNTTFFMIDLSGNICSSVWFDVGTMPFAH